MCSLASPAERSETGDTLCERCSVLSFNDEAFRNYVQDDNCSTLPAIPGDDHGKDFHLDYDHIDLFPQLPSLTASANAGCTFCDELRKATLAIALSESCSITYRLRYRWRSPITPWLGLCMLLVDLSVVDDNEHVNDNTPKIKESLAFAIESEGDCRKWLQTLQSPHERPLCDENITWIRGLLEQDEIDLGKHPENNFIPTRLIDLGNDESEAIRLVEGANLPSCPTYVALSYCWGSPSQAAKQLKTTSSTLQQHYQQLPTEGITEVISDAIKVTRALAVRYLWIDALCIIQGNDQDWARESQYMGHVYASAYATICSLSSTSCLQGFLSRSSPVRVSFRSSIGPKVAGTYYLRRNPRLDNCDYLDVPLPLLAQDFGASSWWYRAWTCQEQELSRRKILFGPSRIHVISMTSVATEASTQSSLWRGWVLDKLLGLTPADDYSSLYSYWRLRSEMFAFLNLSERRDRFPAISGLAMFMAKALDDEYIAGLWQKDIIHGLLWRCESKFESTQREYLQQYARPGSEEYICPSWSWAQHGMLSYPRTSTDEVDDSANDHFSNYPLKSECKSFRAWSRLESRLNPYGRIEDAKIHTTAKLLNLTSTLELVHSGSPLQTWHTALQNGSQVICDLDWRVSDKDRPLILQNAFMLLLASGLGNTEDKPLMELVQPDEAGKISTNTKQDLKEGEEGMRDAWGLLISPIGDGEYMRVGRFKIWAEAGGLRAFEDCEWKTVVLS